MRSALSLVLAISLAACSQPQQSSSSVQAKNDDQNTLMIMSGFGSSVVGASSIVGGADTGEAALVLLGAISLGGGRYGRILRRCDVGYSGTAA